MNANAVNDLITSQPFLNVFWNVYHTLFQKEDLIYKRNLKSEQTEAIQEADNKRDEVFVNLKASVSLSLRIGTADEKVAAKALTFIIDSYKDADKQSQVKNTVLRTNLLQELEKPENAAHTETLHLENLVAELGEWNTKFQEAFRERSDEQHEQLEEGTMRSVRPQVDKAFRSFADAVNLQFQANKAGDKDDGIRQTLTQVIDSLNANIETFEHALSRRGAGKTNSGGTGGGDTPQPEPAPTPEPEPEPTPEPEPEPPTVFPVYRRRQRIGIEKNQTHRARYSRRQRAGWLPHQLHHLAGAGAVPRLLFPKR